MRTNVDCRFVFCSNNNNNMGSVGQPLSIAHCAIYSRSRMRACTMTVKSQGESFSRSHCNMGKSSWKTAFWQVITSHSMPCSRSCPKQNVSMIITDAAILLNMMIASGSTLYPLLTRQSKASRPPQRQAAFHKVLDRTKQVVVVQPAQYRALSGCWLLHHVACAGSPAGIAFALLLIRSRIWMLPCVATPRINSVEYQSKSFSSAHWRTATWQQNKNASPWVRSPCRKPTWVHGHFPSMQH